MVLSQHTWAAPDEGAAYSKEAVCALVAADSALAALPPAIHARLAMLARARTFADSTALLHQDDVADHAFLILRGMVRLERADAPGTSAYCEEVGPGTLLGTSPTPGPDRQRATARAVGSVEALTLNHLALALIALQFPDAAAALRLAFLT